MVSNSENRILWQTCPTCISPNFDELLPPLLHNIYFRLFTGYNGDSDLNIYFPAMATVSSYVGIREHQQRFIMQVHEYSG
jgi:hypothetical protein